MIPFSIAVIMKNEENHLDNFFNAIKKHFSDAEYEVIINDTGSDDRSIEIAETHGAKVFESAWCDDFSYSRNLAAQNASYDTILVLDCDEYVTSFDNASDLITDPRSIGRLNITNRFSGNTGNDTYTTVLPRVYDRRFAHFSGSVHEQIVMKNGNAPVYRDLPLSVDHFGYFGTPEQLEEKTLKYEKLLLNELNSKPDDPYVYFQLGQTRNMLRDADKAAFYYSKGLSLNVDPSLEYVKMMITSLGNNLIRLDKPEEALDLSKWLDALKNNSDYLCMLGLAYLRTGRLIEAMQTFLNAMTAEESKTTGTKTFIPLYNMGVINELLGNREGAITLFRQCGDYKPAVDKLNELA